MVEGASQLASNESIARGRFWLEYAATFGGIATVILIFGGFIAILAFFEWVGIGGRLQSIRENNIKRTDVGQKVRYYGSTIVLKIPTVLGFLFVAGLVLLIIVGAIVEPIQKAEKEAAENVVLSVPIALRPRPP